MRSRHARRRDLLIVGTAAGFSGVLPAVAFTVLDVAVWGSAVGALIEAVLLLGCLALALGCRRALRRQERCRPDYARIATLEREIYGETFRHDGAPEPARPGPCLCHEGKDTLDGSHAPGCPAGPGKRERAICPRGHSASSFYYSQVLGDTFCGTCWKHARERGEHPLWQEWGTDSGPRPYIRNEPPPFSRSLGNCAWCHGPLTERWSCGRGSTNTTFTTGSMSLAAMGGGGGGSSYPPGGSHSWTCCSQEHMRLLMQREGW